MIFFDNDIFQHPPIQLLHPPIQLLAVAQHCIVTGVLGILMVGILIYGLIKEKAVLLLPILIYIPISAVIEIIIAIIGIVAIDDPHIEAILIISAVITIVIKVLMWIPIHRTRKFFIGSYVSIPEWNSCC